MQSLIEKQTVLELELDKIITNFKKSNRTVRSNKNYLLRRLNELEERWSMFCSNNREMLLLYNETTCSTLPYFAKDQYSAVDEKYTEIHITIKDSLDEIERREKTLQGTQQQHAQPNTTAGELRLPRITLPHFSGEYRNWASFHDLFDSLINKNESLSSVQKLHYLKCNLSGEAEQLIKHLQITDANYKPAWELLVARYHNKRAIVNSHLKTLMSIPIHNNETADLLKTLMDTTRECIESLKGMDIDVENWDPILIYLLIQKLSNETHSQWEMTLNKREKPTELPTMEEFMNFIETRFRTLEAIGMARTKANKEKETKFKPPTTRGTFTATKGKGCILCKQEHQLKECSIFVKLDLDSKRDVLQKHSYCYNCLKPGHSVSKCYCKFNCKLCNRRHHTLLHPQQPSPEVHSTLKGIAVESKMEDKRVHKVLVNNAREREISQCRRILLATALVSTVNKKGECVTLRALLDQGSEATFITESAVQKLSLRKRLTNTIIKGVGGTETASVNKIARLTIASHLDPHFTLDIQALVLSKITGTLPPTKIDYDADEHIKGLKLADPTYFRPGRIDLLLGADIYAVIIQEGIQKSASGKLLAQQTRLGWILSGEASKQNRQQVNLSLESYACTTEVDTLLRRFWELEEMQTQQKLSSDELKSEGIYENSKRRNKEGRYSVKLPFKAENLEPSLSASRNTAVRQLLQIERRFTVDNNFHTRYCAFIDDYISQCHMELVGDIDTFGSPNYLPHHAVLKESSSTTKLRVVFDASRKTSNGMSLNDNLLVGPTVQEDLFSILTRWRKHKVVFTADIKQMYRQILIDTNQADYQRIVWRSTPEEPIKEYRLLTVTYGTACAPYLATRTLNQLAIDEATKYPVASRVLQQDFYVDDVMSGVTL